LAKCKLSSKLEYNAIPRCNMILNATQACVASLMLL
jgi:hypothetical protein